MAAAGVDSNLASTFVEPRPIFTVSQHTPRLGVPVWALGLLALLGKSEAGRRSRSPDSTGRFSEK